MFDIERRFTKSNRLNLLWWELFFLFQMKTT